MLNFEYLIVSFEIQTDGGVETLPMKGLSVLPSVGDEVALDYVHGKKILFVVQGVKHHLSSIGDNILQQITVYGTAA